MNSKSQPGARRHRSVLTLGLIEATRRGMRLFANKVGSAWVGRLVNQWADSGAGTCVELKGASFQPFGLLVPSSEKKKVHGGGLDAIGWTPLIVTEEMVGHPVAVFTIADAKTEGYNTMSKDQKNFVREVLKAGGIAYIIRADEDNAVEFFDAGPEAKK